MTRKRRNGAGDTPKHYNPYIDDVPVANYPIYLPFKVQHVFYNTIQRHLEEACFAFAKRHLPALLEKLGWETPEAGEFSAWWPHLKNEELPFAMATLTPGRLFDRLHTVRHSAVHRLVTELNGLKYMCEDATALAAMLENDPIRNKLRRIEQELYRGGEENLLAVIEQPPESFATFEFPGELPASERPRMNRQLVHRSKSVGPSAAPTVKSDGVLIRNSRISAKGAITKGDMTKTKRPSASLLVGFEKAIISDNDLEDETISGVSKKVVIDLTEDYN